MKENLVQIGIHSRLGIPIYTYNYAGDPEQHIGVLAGDVMTVKPGAVYERAGWSMVDYGAL